MILPEVLAPCGSMESLLAALRCGADAVYLGLNKFSARSGCSNFSFDELQEASKLCAVYGAKLYVAVNTLVSDDELFEAMESVKKICRVGADAVIIQDLGLAGLIKNAAPALRLHASTQMTVHTPSGVNLLQKMGYTTAVLPRELSKAEIVEISKSSSMRLEAFVHGALCMCVSGQCYLSSMIGGRSGNRGMCAQPCRLPFSSSKKAAYDLSLKDLSLEAKTKEMIGAGISSLKIEGRMKRPEYTAAAVTVVKQAVQGRVNKEMAQKLENVFSRSGFTDGYFTGKLGKEMFGTRTKSDVLAADSSVFKELSKLYEKPAQFVEVDFCFSAKEGKPYILTATARNESIEIFSDDVPSFAINKTTTANTVRTQLAKCGGTVFVLKNAEIDLDEGLYIPLSQINKMRSAALLKLYQKLSKKSPIEYNFKNEIKFNFQKREIKSSKLIIRVPSSEVLPSDLSDVFAVISPFESTKEIFSKLSGTNIKIIAELPRVMFGKEQSIRKKLIDLKEFGISCALAPTLDAASILKELDFEIFGGFSLNVFNSFSAFEFSKLGLSAFTLSPELTSNKIKKLQSPIPTASIVYGRLPLMVSRNCPVKNQHSCAECQGKLGLTDRKGKFFPVACSKSYVELLNSCPIYMGDKLSELKTDYRILYFSTESAEEAGNVLNLVRNKGEYFGEFTRGLYFRGVK